LLQLKHDTNAAEPADNSGPAPAGVTRDDIIRRHGGGRENSRVRVPRCPHIVG
jgi:hypothetical protein